MKYILQWLPPRKRCNCLVGSAKESKTGGRAACRLHLCRQHTPVPMHCLLPGLCLLLTSTTVGPHASEIGHVPVAVI